MSAQSSITIATRESPLAMWQAEHIRDALHLAHSSLTIEILGMTTKGDQILESSLSKVGGKGLFVKELEVALLEGRADLAVHSAKDMPMTLPEGLELYIVDQRAEPRDALVLPVGSDLEKLSASEVSSKGMLDLLPQNAVIGTSSLRRQCQLLHYRPDLRCVDLRGNINTRLKKLDNGEYDAIILAAAGLQRMAMTSRISQLLPPAISLPAVGQGALAIELRENDEYTKQCIATLFDSRTSLCVEAERAMNNRLEGSCQVPIAGHAQLEGVKLTLQGRVGAIDGTQLLKSEAEALLETPLIVDGQQIVKGLTASALSAAQQLGWSVADALLAQGARQLLDQAEDQG